MGTLLFLGTGGAAGVPMLGCQCEVCLSDDPLNHRLRASALLEVEGKKFVIDVGPDYRRQALKFGINAIDGVLITHTHYDHIGGLDELRSYYIIHRKSVPLLVSKTVLEDLQRRYPYFFLEKKKGISLAPQLDFHLLPSDRGHVEFSGLEIDYMTYSQGGMQVTGYRFGDLAYISDIREYPSTLIGDLVGVKTLVVSALRHTASDVHFSLNEAIEFSRQVGASKTYFTHMSHELDFEKTSSLLPKGFALAHDGLKIEFEFQNGRC